MVTMDCLSKNIDWCESGLREAAFRVGGQVRTWTLEAKWGEHVVFSLRGDVFLVYLATRDSITRS